MENNNTSSSKIGETPHVQCHKKRINTRSSSSSSSSYTELISGDSGYITQTPNSASSTTAYTPNAGSNCRPRLSAGSNSTGRQQSTLQGGGGGRRRYPRFRTTELPWPSERGNRLRSKFNNRLDVTDVGDLPSSSNFIINANNPEGRGDYQKSINNGRSLNSELEGLLRVHNGDDLQQQQLTSIPKTPASTLQLLSTPPSPAVPSLSFVASEPIEEDVEMKLVIVPQSTPQSILPIKSNNNNDNSLSPKTSRPSPLFSSIENHSKLSKLMITDLTMSEIRPKRLDFSQRPKLCGLNRSRAIPDQAGKRYVDFMKILGEESNHRRIVSKILALISVQDLCSISMVSNTWRRICSEDTRANTRRLHYVILRQNVKENLKRIQAKAKGDCDIVASPKSKFVRKGFLVEVQNLIQPPANTLTPSSPPVSPSKVKFHSFVKAGRTLEPSEYLLPCPRCSFACHVNGEKNIASCSRQGCSMEFCICCSSRHTGPCKTALLATPTKRNKRLIAGSRQSKRNLRRL